MTNIAPVAPSSSIFSYYAYSDGALSETPLKTPLEANAALTIEVRIALTATPGDRRSADSGAPASIQGSAEAAPHPALLQRRGSEPAVPVEPRKRGRRPSR